jgi:hypothetical protein
MQYNQPANINNEIKNAQFSSEREIASIDIWYKVRREQLLKQLEKLDNEYSTMLAECNVKWATRLLELDILHNYDNTLIMPTTEVFANDSQSDSRRIQYKSNATATNPKQELALNDFEELESAESDSTYETHTSFLR